MHKWLGIGVMGFAFLAAIFWFCSALGKLPPIVSYWDYAPNDDPFYAAMIYSARMNKYAAIFSGLSAMCMAAQTFCKSA